MRYGTPNDVVIPIWLGLGLAAVVAVAGFAGWRAKRRVRTRPERAARAVFVGSAIAYAGTSLVDFAEHLRLEKVRTGRYLAACEVPLGESANHVLTVATIVALLVLARPLPRERLEARDVFVLLAPAAITALGWRDEIVYHRRRSQHREDMMHTVSHIGLAGMLAGLFAARVVRRPRPSMSDNRAQGVASASAVDLSSASSVPS